MLFVNVLDMRIAEYMRITMTPDTNLAQLLDQARKKSNTIRYIYEGIGSSMRCSHSPAPATGTSAYT